MKLRIRYRSGDGPLALLMFIGWIVLLIAALTAFIMYFEYTDPDYGG